MRKNNVADLTGYAKSAKLALNLGGLLSALTLLLYCMSLLSIVVALSFIVRGYKADPAWVGLSLAPALLAFAIHYICRRVNLTGAAAKADSELNIKDGLVSALGFAGDGKSGAIYELQAEHTKKSVAKLSAFSLFRLPPKGLLVVSVAAIVTVGYLMTIKDSPDVIAERNARALTEKKSEDVKKFLSKKLKEIEKDLDEDEKELLKSSGLKKRVDKLKKTQDIKEALREYAKLEKKMAEVAKSFSTKKDEKFLSKLSKDIARNKASAELARKLAQKKYKDAAKEMDKLKKERLEALKKKPDSLSKKDAMKKFQQSKDKFSGLRKAASRMSKSSKQQKNSTSDFKQKIEDMDASAEELQEALEECDKQFCKNGECDKDGQKKMMGKASKMAKDMDKLAKMLSKMDARKKFSMKMQGLKQALGQSQSYMLSQKPGGLKAGQGSSDLKSDTVTKSELKDPNTKITGLKGKGPSQVSIEDASSGIGVSRIPANRKINSYKTQMESLVKREDIPQHLKQGVKTYFKTIHEDGNAVTYEKEENK